MLNYSFLRRLAKLILSLSVIFSICLVTIEVSVRFIHNYIYPLYMDKTSMWVDHPLFHHWHLPNAKRTYRAVTGEFTVTNRTNSFGMAGKEISLEKNKDVFRIALLGDSFVEGFTTEEEKSIVYVLEHLLNERGGKKFEILNFGCSSFSPSLEYFNLLYYAKKFDPDMVILMFHVTDVNDDWRYTRRQVIKKNSEIVGINGMSRKSPFYKLAEQSVFLKVIVQRVNTLIRYRHLGNSNDLTQGWAAMFKTTYNDRDYEAWNITKHFLGKINTWCTVNKVHFLLVSIPVAQQLEAVDMKQFRHIGLNTSGKIITATVLQDVLKEWSAENNVVFIDLLPHAKKFKKRKPDRNLYYPLDQHFNADGNEMAARAISDVLAEVLYK